MSKTGVRQKIIRELLRDGKLSVTQLSERVGVSRVSVSKELQLLCDKAIVTKATVHRGYTLSSGIAFVIFKLYKEYAELVSVSLDGSMHTRDRVQLLYSLPHDDNVLFLSQRIKNRAQMLKKKFSQVFICIIHDEKLSLSASSLPLFDFAALRPQLIARHIEYSSNEESILYVNTTSSLSLICKGGTAITPNSYPISKDLQSSNVALSLVRPSRIVLEGKECAPLVLASKKLNIPLTFINTEEKMLSDELGMIEEIIFSLSK